MIEVTNHHTERNGLRMRLSDQEALQNGKRVEWSTDFKRESILNQVL